MCKGGFDKHLTSTKKNEREKSTKKSKPRPKKKPAEVADVQPQKDVIDTCLPDADCTSTTFPGPETVEKELSDDKTITTSVSAADVDNDNHDLPPHYSSRESRPSSSPPPPPPPIALPPSPPPSPPNPPHSTHPSVPANKVIFSTFRQHTDDRKFVDPAERNLSLLQHSPSIPSPPPSPSPSPSSAAPDDEQPDVLKGFSKKAKQFAAECDHRRKLAAVQGEKARARTIAEQAKQVFLQGDFSKTSCPTDFSVSNFNVRQNTKLFGFCRSRRVGRKQNDETRFKIRWGPTSWDES